MLNRIFVGLAIAASIFVAAFGFFKVKPTIETVITQRDTEKDNRVKAETELAQTKKKLKSTEDKLKSTEDRLKTTTDDKNKALADVTKLKTDIERKNEDLKRTGEELAEARAKLFIWDQLNVKPEQIKVMVQQIKDLTEESTAQKLEKKNLLYEVAKLNNKIADLIGSDVVVELPQGLRGTVAAVDPKWDFCVLSVGQNQGVLEKGQLLVNRNGKLIAKVQVQSVQQDRCIANVIPGWRLQDVLEGDAVFPANN